MVVRRDKKSRKYRGKRNQGYGCHKKHRGSGSRGGSGDAGMHKFKWSFTLNFDPGHFGKHGFAPPKAVFKNLKTINVDEIEALAGSKKKIDLGALGYDKVLGAGRISKQLEVIAPVFTKSAAKKIEAAGGKCEGKIPAEKKTAKRTKEAKASKSEDADSEDEEGEGKGSEGEESEEEE